MFMDGQKKEGGDGRVQVVEKGAARRKRNKKKL